MQSEYPLLALSKVRGGSCASNRLSKMQALRAQQNEWKRRNVTLCLVVILCLLPLFMLLFTTLYADYVDERSWGNDTDDNGVSDHADLFALLVIAGASASSVEPE